MTTCTWVIIGAEAYPEIDLDQSKRNLLNIVTEEQQRFHPTAREVVIHWQVPDRKAVQVYVYDQPGGERSPEGGTPMRPVWASWKWVRPRETPATTN